MEFTKENVTELVDGSLRIFVECLEKVCKEEGKEVIHIDVIRNLVDRVARYESKEEGLPASDSQEA